MGQCQSNCKTATAVPTTKEVFSTANPISASSATLVKSCNALSIDTSTSFVPNKRNGKIHLHIQTQTTPSTVSMNSRTTPASSFQDEGSTPLNNEELKQALNPRPSKSTQRKRRSRSHITNYAHPVDTSARSTTSFIPVVSLNACNTAFIPEEKDPDAPSDEEENHRDVELQRKLEQPHMRYQRHTWVHTAKSGVSPLSIDLPSLSPVPPDNKAVHPHALSHFQKLKIAAEVATQQMKRQQRISAEEERVQDVYDQRQRWTEYEAIQSGSHDNSHANSSATDAVKTKRKHKQNQSFDLSDTDSWYFDFQGHDFEADARQVEVDPYCDEDSTSQASLSLLSQSSMEAQRRLFAEKAKRRGKGRPRSMRSKSIDGKSVRSTSSVPLNDYGPKEKLRSAKTSADIIEGLEFEFASQVTTKNDEDLSHVSEIADVYSLSNSSHYTTALNNDYGVARRRYRAAAQPDDSDSRNSVDPRFEEILRAVKIGKVEPNERVISTGPSLSARLDLIEKQLAAVESYCPEEAHSKVPDQQSVLTDRCENKERNVSALISVFETTPRVASTTPTPASSELAHLHSQSDHLPPALPIHGGLSVPSSTRRRENLGLWAKQPIVPIMDSSESREQISAIPEISSDLMDAPRQRVVLGTRNSVPRNVLTGKIRLNLASCNGSPTDNAACRSNTPQNSALFLQPNIKPMDTAERVRCLSNLVHSNSTSIQLSSSQAPYHEPCNSPERASKRVNHSADILGRNCHIPLRESRIPLVLGPSTQEFLQYAETFRDTLDPDRFAHGGKFHCRIGSSSHCEEASLCSDSSTSEFGEIMAMKPNHAENHKKRHPELNGFADTSLLRAEKVEAQVNDVLTKYRKTSS